MLSNLFADLPPPDSTEEQYTQLLCEPGVMVERIVSTGQCSPPAFWYEQAAAEWVVLISGEAVLRFEDESEARRLKAGDCIDIAAGRRHRVDWTAPDVPTIWLAIHRPTLVTQSI